tara:strand:- start:85307 stop:86296 length:990 start_codon:yes stop_codon:yes gene_type:complete
MDDQAQNYEKGSVCIAMGIYNGSSFLEQQLQSILDQGHQNWLVLAGDDASQDNSTEVVSRYLSEQISIQQSEKNQGVVGNFNQLLSAALKTPSEYIALSDQDDVWKEEKLQEQLHLMRQLESQNPGKPVLVHSDMEVVDRELQQIAPSFMRFQGVRQEDENPLRILLVQNFVTGCTVLMNRRLLEIALPLPEHTLMHDWWLALCAATMGKIGFVPMPLVKYRQHGNNEVGAKPWHRLVNPLRHNHFQIWNEGRYRLLETVRQAQALAERVKAHFPNHDRLPLIEGYAELLELPPWSRIQQLNRLGIHCQSQLRHLLMLSRFAYPTSQAG